ncbi:Phosphoglycerate mutase-like protein AT74H [Diplonema papillatum]|nr:Phosphoglycerate mutase-like protein AT74H [Diplonema papillatum]
MAAEESWSGLRKWFGSDAKTGSEPSVAAWKEPRWSAPAPVNPQIKRVILLRHAQSAANADHEVYGQVPDWKIPLTKTGKDRAVALGARVRQLVGNDPVFFYVSPFVRTQQTYKGVRRGMGDANIIGALEDPRISEQQFGNYQNPRTMNYLFGVRQLYGRFFWRFKEGESGADVYNRVSNLVESSLASDHKKPVTVVLVTHGLSLRCFLMRWFWMSVRDFEKMTNPPNCAMVVINQKGDGAYELMPESKPLISFPDNVPPSS